MKSVVIMNPKGGVGKSTLTTNIAGYFARNSHNVMLGDTDIQQSSKKWLLNRPGSLPKINTWDHPADLVITAKAPPSTTHIVIDTAASVSGWRLDKLIERADKIVVPLQPNFFDIQATYDFIQYLKSSETRHQNKVQVIAMRVNPRTKSWNQLMDFAEKMNIYLLTYIRDTQNYSQFSNQGITLFDAQASLFPRDYEQRGPLCEWLDSWKNVEYEGFISASGLLQLKRFKL